MYQGSGSQFFRTSTRIQSGPETFEKYRFIMIFLTILGVTEILYSFRLILDGKTSKVKRYRVIKIRVLREVFSKQYCFIRCRRKQLLVTGQRRYSRFTFVEKTISNSPKVPRAKLLESDELLFYQLIQAKFCSFKKPFASITSLFELYFRFRKLFLLVQSKK